MRTYAFGAALAVLAAITPAAAQDVGVASCDGFLKTYNSCIGSKVPEAQRPQMTAVYDALKKNLKSEFDVGIRCGYYFSFNKLFNYADVWGLLTTFPAELQNFVPKSINHKHASMRTLQVVCTRQDLILQENSDAAGYWIVI